MVFAGASYDSLIVGAFDLTVDDFSKLLWEQSVTIGMDAVNLANGLTKPLFIRKFSNTNGLFLYITYVNEISITVTRWKTTADVNGISGLETTTTTPNPNRAGLTWSRTST